MSVVSVSKVFIHSSIFSFDLDYEVSWAVIGTIEETGCRGIISEKEL